MTSAQRHLRGWLARIPGALLAARLVLETIRVSLRYRVTGLASEIGYFALLSLPPLVLGLFGGIGYVSEVLGPETVHVVRHAIETYAARFLTPEIIASTITPTFDTVTSNGRIDLISVGFVLSLWSGSRALNVIIDTVAIMYGQSGVRGIVPTRALSFSLYVLAVLLGAVTLPLLFIGPTWLARIVPEEVSWLTSLYWPVVTLITVASMASLFHIATPRKSPWVRDIPGAVLALLLWAIASFVVRGVVASSLRGGTSIYGPLSAPIVILIWFYFIAISVLIGAAFNAALRGIWPYAEDVPLFTRLKAWARRRFTKGGAAEPVGDDEIAVIRDPFDEEDELDLQGLREAAAGPLTPLWGEEFVASESSSFTAAGRKG